MSTAGAFGDGFFDWRVVAAGALMRIGIAWKKFTQPQLFACLVLKEFMLCDYRKLTAWFGRLPGLMRHGIGLETVPHFTIVSKSGPATAGGARRQIGDCSTRPVRLGAGDRSAQVAGAVALAMVLAAASRITSSHYYVKRRAQLLEILAKNDGTRGLPKLACCASCATHLILAIVPGRGQVRTSSTSARCSTRDCDACPSTPRHSMPAMMRSTLTNIRGECGKVPFCPRDHRPANRQTFKRATGDGK